MKNDSLIVFILSTIVIIFMTYFLLTFPGFLASENIRDIVVIFAVIDMVVIIAFFDLTIGLYKGKSYISHLLDKSLSSKVNPNSEKKHKFERYSPEAKIVLRKAIGWIILLGIIGVFLAFFLIEKDLIISEWIFNLSISLIGIGTIILFTTHSWNEILHSKK
jgi:hypothetical protein